MAKKKNAIVEKSTYAIDSFEEKQGIPYEAARLRRLGLIQSKKKRKQQLINLMVTKKKQQQINFLKTQKGKLKKGRKGSKIEWL